MGDTMIDYKKQGMVDMPSKMPFNMSKGNTVTDFEKLKNIFTEFGIKYETDESMYNQDKLDFDEAIIIGSKYGGIGYGGFTAEFYFMNGKFVGHGEWE